jgi:hypothetical protein
MTWKMKPSPTGDMMYLDDRRFAHWLLRAQVGAVQEE